jgi:hypothetical protein
VHSEFRFKKYREKVHAIHLLKLTGRPALQHLQIIIAFAVLVVAMTVADLT